MFDPSIQDILRARLQSLPELVWAARLTHDIDDLVARHVATGRIVVVDDHDTASAYGDAVFRALKGRYEATHITLPRAAKADEAALAEVETRSARADLLVAVGSGSVNDVVKLASFRAGKPYVLFPTAASMNGYVSHSASISLHGHKQSLLAQLPLAVFMDREVIARAPVRLTQAGLGDSLARPTAQADWLLSHHLLGTTYDETPYSLLSACETTAFGQARGLLAGDHAAVLALMQLLLLSGFGMTIAGSSIPASGAEHMLAHAYGMSHGPQHHNLHGEEIAFTTLAVAGRQQRLLESTNPPRLLALKMDVDTLFDAETTASFAPLYAKKSDAIQQALPGLSVDKERWEKAREAMAAVQHPPAALQAIANEAKLPARAETLGWDSAHYQRVASVARFTRDRFTCLDIAA